MQQENQNPAEAGTPTQQQPAQPEPARQRPKAPLPKPDPIGGSPGAPIPAGFQAVRNRHDVGFRHHVLKGSEELCITNQSYKAHEFIRMDLKHVHVYHSHDSHGKKRLRTNSALGHWHEVTLEVDPASGAVRAKCGPPIHEVQYTSEKTGRSWKRNEPVAFEYEVDGGNEGGKIMKVVDNHTHKFTHEGYEDLSPLGIQKDLKEQKALAAAMGMSFDMSTAIKDNTPATMTPADGATIE